MDWIFAFELAGFGTFAGLKLPLWAASTDHHGQPRGANSRSHRYLSKSSFPHPLCTGWRCAIKTSRNKGQATVLPLFSLSHQFHQSRSVGKRAGQWLIKAQPMLAGPCGEVVTGDIVCTRDASGERHAAFTAQINQRNDASEPRATSATRRMPARATSRSRARDATKCARPDEAVRMVAVSDKK